MFRMESWYFLLLIPLIVYLFLQKRKQQAIKFSSIQLIKSSGTAKTVKHKIGRYFILVGVIFLIVGLARPQLLDQNQNLERYGIDILLALDVSGSMQSVDFKPNRLEAAKKVTEDFIAKRINDRLGLVIFSGTAYTKIPLTVDYNILKNVVSQVSTGDVNKDGTAIGMGISVALNRLKNSEARSKIIILVTDGDNNAGIITPDTAAKLAKDMGIKIYTIGVGSDKTIVPVQDGFGNISYRQMEGGLNEELLKQIANVTGGRYFRAYTGQGLEDIFSTIDKLEKTKIDFKNYLQYKELFYPWVIAGLIAILIGMVLEEFVFIKIP